MHKPKSTHTIILYYDYGIEHTMRSNFVGSWNMSIILYYTLLKPICDLFQPTCSMSMFSYNIEKLHVKLI